MVRARHSVCVIESRDTIGGGARSAELTAPGFIHDVCSAVHPLGVASPFFKSVPLAKHGLEWIQPPAAPAHPFDDEPAAILHRSIESTCATLEPDARAYAKRFSPFVRNAEKWVPEILGPPVHLPRHPLLLMRFGSNAIQSAAGFAKRNFRGG